MFRANESAGFEDNAMTNSGVTLKAEVNPWRAGCSESCKSGSEERVRKRVEGQRALPLSYEDIGKYECGSVCIPGGARCGWCEM
jgi:hypothetical protein